jgi:hypothetical protein
MPRLSSVLFRALLVAALTLPASLPVSAQRLGRANGGVLARQGAAPAQAAISGYARGSVQTLGISGTTGDHMETILAPGNGWIYGLEIGEKADQPCYLGIWAVEGAVPAPGFPTAFDRCAGSVTETSVKTVGFAYASTQSAWNAVQQFGPGIAIGLPGYSEIQLVRALFAASNANPPLPFVGGEPVALDGLGICQRNGNDELKGLRVHGSMLDLSGASVVANPIVTTQPTVAGGVTIPPGARRNEQAQRPNCNSWQTIRTCPSGKVLVGLDVHYKFPNIGNQERARITGLAPKCAAITIQRR